MVGWVRKKSEKNFFSSHQTIAIFHSKTNEKQYLDMSSLQQRRKGSKTTVPKSGKDKQKHQEAEDEELSSYALQRKDLNKSAGRKIYERAKSRHLRHRAALMGEQPQHESSTVPLGRGGRRGPHGTSSLSMRRFSHPDETDLDAEYEKRGQLRFRNLRASILQATSPARNFDATTKRRHSLPNPKLRSPPARIGLTSSKRKRQVFEAKMMKRRTVSAPTKRTGASRNSITPRPATVPSSAGVPEVVVPVPVAVPSEEIGLEGASRNIQQFSKGDITESEPSPLCEHFEI